jgi:putative Mg2+ transporter-C (MgtC) family protein
MDFFAQIYQEFMLDLYAHGNFIVRVTLAAILGGLIGLEREWGLREAGLRTNMLIAIASCLFTYLGIEAFPFGEGIIRDPARIAAQIVSGVGFLGAGAVLQRRNKIQGLTTAATIWLVAAIGMAAGAGDYFSAIFSTIVALVALIMLRPFSRRMEEKAIARYKARQAARQLAGEQDKIPPFAEEEYDDEDTG